MEIAQSMESATTKVREIKESAAGQGNKLTTSKKKPASNGPLFGGVSGTCYRCGCKNHLTKDCPFKEATCHKCSKVGHLANVCRSKKSGKKMNPSNSQCIGEVTPTENPQNMALFTIRGCSSNPIRVEVQARCKICF